MKFRSMCAAFGGVSYPLSPLKNKSTRVILGSIVKLNFRCRGLRKEGGAFLGDYPRQKLATTIRVRQL